MAQNPVEKIKTIAAAASRLGVDESVVHAARAAGCMAWRHSAIYMDELRDFLIDHPEVAEAAEAEGNTKETETKWRIERQKKTCRKLDLEYEQKIGELVPRQQLRESIASAFAPICVTLEKHLDLPTYNLVCKQLREALTKIETDTMPEEVRNANMNTASK